MKLARLLAILLLSGTSSLAAQGILIAPTTVLIDSRLRTTSVILVNPNSEPAEVEVGTLFGYPVTDSAGQLTMRFVEQPDSTLPSALEWIRAFPRRVTIAPGAQQTVRLLVSPPVGIPDGEYWARLAITTRAGTVPIAVSGDTSGVKVGLDLQIRTIVPVLYRKGAVRTSLALSDLAAAVAGDSLVVRGRLERGGNAAAIGTLRGALVDSAGTVRSTFSYPASTYFAIEPRIAQALPALSAGRYMVHVEVTSTREDLEPGTLLPFATVRDSTVLQIPSR